ncbi:hypothetical protein CFP56_026166 [Quercus suber]|uniref:Uncharacterized protein n=1 Tax=Quercus suber TaxID=58331 RepID=A0AAW0K1R4_QUESU
MIHSLALEWWFEDVIEVVFDMLGNSMGPDFLTYKTLLEGCKKVKCEPLPEGIVSKTSDLEISSSSSVPSLLPPCPRSPKVYPDLYYKLWEMAMVQVLEREIGFLEGFWKVCILGSETALIHGRKYFFQRLQTIGIYLKIPFINGL